MVALAPAMAMAMAAPAGPVWKRWVVGLASHRGGPVQRVSCMFPMGVMALAVAVTTGRQSVSSGLERRLLGAVPAFQARRRRRRRRRRHRHRRRQQHGSPVQHHQSTTLRSTCTWLGTADGREWVWRMRSSSNSSNSSTNKNSHFTHSGSSDLSTPPPQATHSFDPGRLTRAAAAAAAVLLPGCLTPLAPHCRPLRHRVTPSRQRTRPCSPRALGWSLARRAVVEAAAHLPGRHPSWPSRTTARMWTT